MDIIEQIKDIIVRRPAAELNEKELCFFQTDAQFGRQVEQITTTSKPGLGIGIGIPVTKHFGIGIGKRKVKTKTTREMVWEKTPCVIMLTTNRFLCLMNKQLYQLELDTFQDIKLHQDGITIISSGNPYYFFMANKDVQKFTTVWGLIGEAAKQGIKVEELM